MVVRILSYGSGTSEAEKKKIRRDNPGSIDYTKITSSTKEARRIARGDDRRADLRKKQTQQSQEINQTLASPEDLNTSNVEEKDRQMAISMNFWQKAAASIRQGYENTDRFLGGYLPGAITPEEDEALDTQQKLESIRKTNAAEIQLYNEQLERNRNKNIYDQQLDLINQSWYEQFGLFQDEQEKLIRELQRKQAAAQETRIQLPQTVTQVERVKEYIRETPEAATVLEAAQKEAEGTDWGKTLIIAAGVLGGVMLISKM